MKYLFFTLLLLSLSSFAARDQITKGSYIGGGFNYGLVGLTPTNQSESNFKGWGGVIEVGTNLELTTNFGLNLAGEYKFSEVNNTLKSDTYMEKASINTGTAKVGFYYGATTVGVGYSSTDVEVKNVSSTASSSTVSFKGSPILYYANYGFEQRGVRSVIEFQYSSGEFDDVTYKDMTIGLRLFVLF